MNYNQAQTNVILWIKALTGRQVIRAHQDAKRPSESYLMVQKGPRSQRTYHPSEMKFEKVDGDVKQTPLVEIEWTFLVYAYGEDGSDHLETIEQAMHVRQMQEMLYVDHMVAHDVGVINSIPEYVDNAWEDRFQMNLMVRGVSSKGFIVDTIETHTPFDIQKV